MCSPAAFAAIGGVTTGLMQYQAANLNAESARDEATQQRVRAADALMMGELVAGRVRDRTTETQAAQQAALAANGISTSSGSAANLLTATAIVGAEDVAQARLNAARQAWGFDLEAQRLDAEAQRRIDMGGLQAASSFLGGAAQAFSYAARK